jgi:hypothetical protein
MGFSLWMHDFAARPEAMLPFFCAALGCCCRVLPLHLAPFSALCKVTLFAPVSVLRETPGRCSF